MSIEKGVACNVQIHTLKIKAAMAGKRSGGTHKTSIHPSVRISCLGSNFATTSLTLTRLHMDVKVIEKLCC